MDKMNVVRLSNRDFIQEAVNIISRGQQEGIILRLLGATAIYFKVMKDPLALELYNKLGRLEAKENLFTDLDVICYSSQKKRVAELFENVLGFKFNPQLKILLGGNRFIYEHPNGLYKVDVFFDKLEFSHTVFFGNKPAVADSRLELDFPTITLADLVLEKLQIHEINRKDLVDLMTLFTVYEIGETSNDPNKIDGKYIAKILSNDWGFYYDAIQNLQRLRHLTLELKHQDLPSGVIEKITYEIAKLEQLIEKEPKTKEWIKRMKIGTKKPWYRKVEELW